MNSPRTITLNTRFSLVTAYLTTEVVQWLDSIGQDSRTFKAKINHERRPMLLKYIHFLIHIRYFSAGFLIIPIGFLSLVFIHFISLES